MKLLKMKEVQEKLAISRTTLWRLRGRDFPEPISVMGSIRFSEEEIERWLKGRRLKSASPEGGAEEGGHTV